MRQQTKYYYKMTQFWLFSRKYQEKGGPNVILVRVFYNLVPSLRTTIYKSDVSFRSVFVWIPGLRLVAVSGHSPMAVPIRTAPCSEWTAVTRRLTGTTFLARSESWPSTKGTTSTGETRTRVNQGPRERSYRPSAVTFAKCKATDP